MCFGAGSTERWKKPAAINRKENANKQAVDRKRASIDYDTRTSKSKEARFFWTCSVENANRAACFGSGFGLREGCRVVRAKIFGAFEVVSERRRTEHGKTWAQKIGNTLTDEREARPPNRSAAIETRKELKIEQPLAKEACLRTSHTRTIYLEPVSPSFFGRVVSRGIKRNFGGMLRRRWDQAFERIVVHGWFFQESGKDARKRPEKRLSNNRK
ncbi:hypothetical protein GALMADRAFT_216594 [Galerina marginata CBS 339.88]|uniref:Uncharacterized protein n=1 Tax=Galerina marginata (strain CBS 339.88) TaxID=685588 RepID=A0A067SBJ0_GALM3|nr:hypothetical protein GALMADRAFT_216594 [Galerina marginata CBS 339.88]